MIIGSYFSSFSDEASSFKLIPKITPLSKERIENIQDTVQQYHCLNYSYIDNIRKQISLLICLINSLRTISMDLTLLNPPT